MPARRRAGIREGASTASSDYEGLSATVPRPSQQRWLGLEAEWWVAVGDQEEGVGADAVVPTQDALYEVE
jgi:hypothetical protein